MKTTLEKWLLFFGALLFCWLAVPELKASAAEQCVYTCGSDEIVHMIDGNKHTFTGERVGGTYEVVLDDTNKYISVYSGVPSGAFTILVSSTQKIFIGLDTSTRGKYVTPYGSGWTGREYWSDGSYSNVEYGDKFVSGSEYVTSLTKYVVYSNADIYDSSGSTLVFHVPLPTPTPSLQQQFQTAVETTNLEAVMNQVVGLVPLLIGFLITLISFSKGLQLLSQILRRA